MLRFIILDGLPYLYVDGKAYKCRFDDEEFTPTTEEVKITEEPVITYREIEIKAQCACLDSIGRAADEQAADESPVAEKTLEEMKEYAKAHGIKLGRARTKAEIIEKISATEQAVIIC